MKIRIAAVAAAWLFDIVFGGLWYSPLLFGGPWHELQGLDPAALSQGRGHVHGISALFNLLKVLMMAALVVRTRAEGWKDGLKLGWMLWAGMVLTIHVGSTLYADRSLTVLAINMSFHLIAFSVVGALIAGWRKPI